LFSNTFNIFYLFLCALSKVPPALFHTSYLCDPHPHRVQPLLWTWGMVYGIGIGAGTPILRGEVKCRHRFVNCRRERPPALMSLIEIMRCTLGGGTSGKDINNNFVFFRLVFLMKFVPQKNTRTRTDVDRSRIIKCLIAKA